MVDGLIQISLNVHVQDIKIKVSNMYMYIVCWVFDIGNDHAVLYNIVDV